MNKMKLYKEYGGRDTNILQTNDLDLINDELKTVKAKRDASVARYVKKGGNDTNILNEKNHRVINYAIKNL